jgi:hypothetical protein
MRVSFRRTGERRYAVEVGRADDDVRIMDPAPGFDPLMPHDLLHLVVEDVLGLQGGIFGQLAAGGHAGTFRPADDAELGHRERARERRRDAKRGGRIQREGRSDAARSERATYLCLYEWLARAPDAAHRARARAMAAEAGNIHARLSDEERLALDVAALTRACARLDRLSARWQRLQVGESLDVTWPLAKEAVPA